MQSLPAARDLRSTVPTAYASSPGRLLRWAALDWFVILTTWLAMAHFDQVMVTIFGIAVVAIRLQALGAILHDACHSRIRSRGWPLVEAVAGWPIGSTIAAMRYHHLRHHRHSGTTLDPYRNKWIARGPVWRCTLILRGALLPLWWTLRAVVAPVAWHWPQFRVFYARAFLQDRSDDDLAGSTEVSDCLIADVWQLGAQLVLFTGAFLLELPIIEFYLIPWILAGIINARRVIYEHSFEPVSNSRRATVYAATNDHECGIVLSWLLYPHNLGFHRAHHLYPTASFEHLPRLSAAVQHAHNKA